MSSLLGNNSFGSTVWGGGSPGLTSAFSASMSRFQRAGSFRHHLPTALPEDYFEQLEEELGLAGSGGAGHFKSSGSPHANKGPSIVGDGCEETEVCQDMLVAMEYLHKREDCLKRPDLFRMNDEMQSMKELPLKEVVRGQFWDQWRECCDRHINSRLKVAVKLRGLLLTRKIDSLTFLVPIGTSSILDLRSATLHHIWRDAKGARNFNSLWKRLWEALFEYRIDSIHCPSSVMLAMQGYFVTSTALPPLDPSMRTVVPRDREDPKATAAAEMEEDDVSSVAEMEMLSYLMRRVRIVTGATRPFPLHKGVDGRFYIMSIEPLLGPLRYLPNDGWDSSLGTKVLARAELVKKKLFDFIAAGGPRAQSESHASAVGNRPTRSLSIWEYTVQVCVPRATVDLLDTITKMVDISEGQVRVDDIVNKRIIPIIMHAHGCNLCLMYQIFSSPLMTPCVDEDGMELVTQPAIELLRQALLVEMVGRTLKQMCRLDLSVGEGREIEDRDAYRVAVPNRIASLYVSKDVRFWQQNVMSMVRRKFMAPADFSIPIDVAPPGIILRHMTQRIGCEISQSEFRFGSFCWCSSSNAMVLRPPHLMQLFRSKQYAELDTEMENMWRRVERVFATDGVTNTTIAIYAHAVTATAMARSTSHVQLAMSFFFDKIAPLFQGDPVVMADVSGWISEFMLCNNPDPALMVKNHLPVLQKLRETPLDAPYIANRMITCGMFTADLNAVLEGLRIMTIPTHVIAAKYSSIYKFGASVAETLLSSATSPDTVEVFFRFAKQHATQADSPKYLLVATSLAVLCDPNGAVLNSPVVTPFACDTYATQVRAFGQQHPAVCLASYHLSFLALAALSPELRAQPAVHHHLQLMVKALAMVRRVPSRKQLQLARGRNTQELLLRVASVLRNVGEAVPSLLLEYHIESMREIDHEVALERIIGAAAQGEGTAESPLGTSSPTVTLRRKSTLRGFGGRPSSSGGGALTSPPGSPGGDLRNIELDEVDEVEDAGVASPTSVSLRRVRSAGRDRGTSLLGSSIDASGGGGGADGIESAGGAAFLNEDVIRRRNEVSSSRAETNLDGLEEETIS